MMIHPLLRLAVKEPHLLLDHLSAYGALAGEEASKTFSSLALRVGLYAGAGVMALVGVILLGVALVLVAATPSDDRTTWAMVVIPLTPFLIAAAMVFSARSKPEAKGLDTLKSQMNADLALLREVTAS